MGFQGGGRNGQSRHCPGPEWILVPELGSCYLLANFSSVSDSVTSLNWKCEKIHPGSRVVDRYESNREIWHLQTVLNQVITKPETR